MNELLKRIEEQAVEIAQLKEMNEDLRRQLRDLPNQVHDRLISSMRRYTANCGNNSSCWVAHQFPLSTE